MQRARRNGEVGRFRPPALDFRYDEPDVGHDKVRLHFNENLFLPDEYYDIVMPRASPPDLRYYTDPHNARLSKRIEEFHGLPGGTVLVTAGADEGLRLAMSLAAHASADKSLAVIEPTYAMASILARQLGLGVTVTKFREDLSLDVDEIARLGVSAVYVCSPNNPTAHVVRELEDLAARLEGLLIYDAAYAEFAGYWIPKFYEYGNVVEVRTFSKAWGLAGLRVGYVVAPKHVIELMKSLSLPHPVSALSAKAVECALDAGRPYVERSIREAEAVREWAVRQIGADKYHGPVNFVTLKLPDARRVAAFLEGRGFVVRVIEGRPLCNSCLRFTLAPIPVMREFVSALKIALGE
jgi:histidinol-phosphate aminotransferase